MSRTTLQRLRPMLWPAIALTGAMLFATWYVAGERTIYIFDFAGYWNMFDEFGALLTAAPLRALALLGHSLRYSDYNMLTPALLAPFQVAFGSGRTVYILAMTVLFLTPSVLLAAGLGRRLATEGRSETDAAIDRVGYAVCLVLALLFPAWWAPLLRGYVAMAGTLTILVIFRLYLTRSFAVQSMGRALLLGALLALLFLTRRWFAYWVVGFFVAAAVVEGAAWLASRKHSWRGLEHLVANLLACGLFATALVLAVAQPLVERVLRTDYAALYGAFAAGLSYGERLLRLAQHLGLAWIIAGLCGLAIMLATPRLRRAGAFLLLQPLVTVLLFARVQVLHPHQVLLVATPLLLGAMLATQSLLEKLRGVSRATALAGVLLTAGLVFGHTFQPGPEQYAAPDPGLLPLRFPPMVRQDMPALNGLLDELPALAHPGDQVYVLASSVLFNDDHLRMGYFARGQRAETFFRLERTAHVDGRDGFPEHLAGADLIVTTWPPATHLLPEDQRVVTLPAELLQSGDGFAEAYTPLPQSFPLEDGRTVRLYRRTRPVSLAEYEDLHRRLEGFYPAWAQARRANEHQAQGMTIPMETRPLAIMESHS